MSIPKTHFSEKLTKNQKRRIREGYTLLFVEVFLKTHCAQTCCLNLQYLKLVCLSLSAEQEGIGQYCQRGEYNLTNLTMGYALHLSNVHFATALHHMHVHLSPA